mgnify:CR=1 FL=1
MPSKGLFGSSLVKKYWMALTGLFLISFLLVHCTLNAFIFFNDGGVTFNEGAEFMAKNPIIRIMEVVLFIGLIATVLTLVVALIMGLVAGYFGGLTDTLISRLMDIVAAFPFLLAVDHILAIAGGRQQAFGPKDEVLAKVVRRDAPAPAPLKVVPQGAG